MKFKIPLQIVELEEDNFHIVISGKFNDGNIGYFAVDTGASKTVFDKNLEELYQLSKEKTEEIHSAGIGEKPIAARLAILKTFYLEKFEVKGQTAALIDLSGINQMYHRTTKLKICGLIGGDFLMKYKAIINYKKRYLQLKI